MQLNLVAHFEKTGIGKMSFCKEQKKSAAFATDLFGRGRRTLSPRSTLVGQDGSTVPKGTVFTAVLFSSFCKKRIKKSAAFATDLFGRGRRTLSPRSTLVGQDGSTVPKGTVFTAVLFSSFCKKRIKKSAAFATDLFGRGRRTLSPRSTLVGQDGSTVPKGTVFTAVLFSSFCKKRIKKSAAFATDLFGRGRRTRTLNKGFGDPRVTITPYP